MFKQYKMDKINAMDKGVGTTSNVHGWNNVIMPAYSLVNLGGRFSTNAVMPSFRSFVENVAWK